MVPRSSTQTLIKALQLLARDIQSQDGVATAALLEAADRMEEMQTALRDFIEVGCEQYDMDCGEQGSQAIKAARHALGEEEE
jgi:hypothetical protein